MVTNTFLVEAQSWFGHPSSGSEPLALQLVQQGHGRTPPEQVPSRSPPGTQRVKGDKCEPRFSGEKALLPSSKSISSLCHFTHSCPFQL